MLDPESYCAVVLEMPADSPHIAYHDNEYGFPLASDDELFGRLILEINQAGLNWTTILNKKEHFRAAYSGWSIQKVAGYGDDDRARLLSDAGIIRNKLKVNAAIHNAGVIRSLQQSHGSFAAWLDSYHPLPKERWVKLFKETFKFTGGEITGEFLMSTGYLQGAHHPECPVYQRTIDAGAAWARA